MLNYESLKKISLSVQSERDKQAYASEPCTLFRPAPSSTASMEVFIQNPFLHQQTQHLTVAALLMDVKLKLLKDLWRIHISITLVP